ncbi:hypothetical protein ACI760_02995 [Capnocytophaga canimorsus]|uniref:hypothetical protein n=1 Tax=Capnocytophaga canimorsus TaxID=28188 RepID=UPI00385EB571
MRQIIKIFTLFFAIQSLTAQEELVVWDLTVLEKAIEEKANKEYGDDKKGERAQFIINSQALIKNYANGQKNKFKKQEVEQWKANSDALKNKQDEIGKLQRELSVYENKEKTLVAEKKNLEEKLKTVEKEKGDLDKENKRLKGAKNLEQEMEQLKNQLKIKEQELENVKKARDVNIQNAEQKNERLKTIEKSMEDLKKNAERTYETNVTKSLATVDVASLKNQGNYTHIQPLVIQIDKGLNTGLDGQFQSIAKKTNLLADAGELVQRGVYLMAVGYEETSNSQLVRQMNGFDIKGLGNTHQQEYKKVLEDLKKHGEATKIMFEILDSLKETEAIPTKKAAGDALKEIIDFSLAYFDGGQTQFSSHHKSLNKVLDKVRKTLQDINKTGKAECCADEEKFGKLIEQWKTEINLRK